MNHTMFARTELGVLAYNRDTGEWEPKALTQIPDAPLSIVPDLTAPVYGKEISKAFAQNKFYNELEPE